MTRNESAASSFTGWAIALSLPVVGGTFLGMSVVYFLTHPIWGDQSIALYVAGLLLDGEEIDIHNFVDPNPPLIFWISEIPVALARWIGIAPQVGLELCLAILLALVIPWCMRLARRMDRGASTAFVWWLALVILYGTAVYPWRYYAQREHLLIIMILPYLMMAAGRLGGAAPAAWEATAAGLLASIGFSLKPYDLSIAIGVEALLAYRTLRLRNLARPEIVALVLGGLGYCVAVVIWTPDYLTKIVPLARAAYLDFDRVPLWKMIYLTRALKIVGLIVLWTMVRRRLRHEPLASVLLVAALAAVVAYLVQHKGFEYQFLPAMVLFNIVLGLMLVDLLLPWAESRQRPSRLPFALPAALLSSLVAGILFYPVQSVRAATDWVNDRLTAQQAIAAGIPRGTTIFDMSPATEALFDILLDRGLIWGSRFPNLWMLETIFHGEFSHDEKGDRAVSIARWTRDAVGEDLQRWHPSVVLVERCDDSSVRPCGSLESISVNLLQWFQRDPAFTNAWSNYALYGTFGPYDLWCAKESGKICRHVLAALPVKK